MWTSPPPARDILYFLASFSTQLVPLVFIKVRPAAVTKWHRKLITTSSGRCHRDRLMKPNKAPVKASVFNYSLLIAFRLLACGQGALFQCNCFILRMIHYLFCCIISRLTDPLGEEKTITGRWALFYSVNLVTSLFWPCFWFFLEGGGGVGAGIWRKNLRETHAQEVVLVSAAN